MKNALLSLMLLIIGVGTKAQVGIGTDMPNPSAQLDVTVQAGDKGVLITRVALTGTTDTSTITNGNLESLLVYNTVTVADITPGYYYWYNNKWNRIVTPDDFATIDQNTTNTSLTTDGVDLILTDSDGNFVSAPLSSLFTETITNLVDNGNGTITYTNEAGTVQTINVATIIQNNETVTTLTDNTDGTYTYTSEDGTITTVDVPAEMLTEITDNTSNVYQEIVNLIDANETLTTSVFDSATGIFTYTDEDGTANDLDLGAMVPNFETTTTVVDNGDGTYTFTNEDGTTTTISITGNETVTTLTNNADGTYTYTSEDGTITTVDVPAEMLTEITDNTSNIYNEIVNLIDAQETLTISVFDPTTGIFTYTDEDGTANDLDLGAMVPNFETTTSIVDNGDGTYTFTNEDGTTTTISITGNETVTTLTDNGDGTYTYTSEDGTITAVDIPADMLTEITDNTSNVYQEIVNLIDAQETLTTSVFDPTTGIFTYTDEDGTANDLDLGAMVPNFETPTSIVDNGDGTYTFTNEDGTTTTISITGNETVTTLTDNGDGTYTYTSEDGTITTVDIPADMLTEITDNTSNVYQEIVNLIDAQETLTTSTFDPTTGIFTYTDEDGTANDLDLGAMVPNFETTTTVVDNGDGTYTFTNEDGTTTTISITGNETLTSLTDNGDGTYTYTSEDGTITTVDIPADMLTEITDNTSNVYQEIVNLIDAQETLTTSTFDPTTGIFTYTDEDGTANDLDLGAMVPNFETTTTVVDNGDGTYTFTNEDGTTTTISITGNETLTSLTDNGDGTYTYTSEDGTITTVDVPTDMLTEITDNTSNVYQEIVNLIDAQETLTTSTFDPTTGIFTYTDEDGTANDLDLGAMVPNFETPTSIVDNGDGTYTFTNEDGTTTTISITGNETVTTLTNNTDGTYTYTSEDGTITTVDIPADMLTEITDNTSNVYQEIVNLIDAQETLTTSVFDPTTGIFTYTDEDGTANNLDLGVMVPNFETPTSIVDNGDGTYTFTNEDGTTTTISITGNETVTTLTNNTDGTYTYTSEDGTITTVDVPADMLTEITDNTSNIYNEIVNLIDMQETVTTLDINAGGLEYANEDGTNNDVNLISTDSNNAITAGADGALFAETVEVTASNGINIDTNTGNVQLGGLLTEITEITTDATNTLAIAGLQDGTDTDNIVVVDPTTGVLKQLKAALPKFFYMPSIVFDTSVTGTGFIHDLHQEYVDQFGTPMVSSTGATGAIPTLPATELEYHITYYDTNVFANVQVDANGVLTYDVIGDATPASFMNIVFVVK